MNLMMKMGKGTKLHAARFKKIIRVAKSYIE